MKRILQFSLIFLLLLGCSREENKTQDSKSPKKAESVSTQGCIGCHPFTIDNNHNLGCSTCHDGNDKDDNKEQAHNNLVTKPAHPDHMQKTCGNCHQELVQSASGSLHFTLHNEINTIRKLFGATESLASLTDILIHNKIETALDLTDDLLRRRCLRCHVYSEGDVYPESVRGTGCAACHLEYKNGELQSHNFLKIPTDEQCLHCHYGNYVGSDYYGRYEHDFSLEFRTPYRTDEQYPRPYGVEYHQLAPDIHQTKGMSCIDCHGRKQLMGISHGAAINDIPESIITCSSCHNWQPGETLPLENLRTENSQLILITRHEGKKLPVPSLRHPAHQTYGKQVACTVCHAQWTFNDTKTHLVRHDAEDYDPWELLTVQGSFEVEDQLITNLYGEGEGYEVPFMRDKISGTPYLGIWFKGYKIRRWESPLIGRDQDGVLKIFRPILDLHLSYVNAEEKVVFDAVSGQDKRNGLRPYTPHTTGKAGAFFRERLKENLPKR